MIRRGIALLVFLLCLLNFSCGAQASEMTGYITAGTLFVREEPYEDASIIFSVARDDRVTILNQTGEWYQIKCANNQKGYVLSLFISLDVPSTARSTGSTTGLASGSSGTNKTPTGTTATGLPSQTTSSSKETLVASADTPTSAGLPAYTRKGDTGNSVRTIQQILANNGYYPGKVDGIFGNITESAVKMFQKERGLVADGIVGKATISVLFGDNLSTASGTSTSPITNITTSNPKTDTPTQNPIWPTEESTPSQSPVGTIASGSNSNPKSLDWFSDGYSLINKNKSITIYDLNSGVTWGAKYINGTNHADIVPASAADAKKITSSKIVGSYVRRPVIVTIAGVNYAGSMYAVGHGEDNYCDYFNGVMCIHFTGSQTHGSKVVDADHQKAIQVALNSTVK